MLQREILLLTRSVTKINLTIEKVTHVTKRNLTIGKVNYECNKEKSYC